MSLISLPTGREGCDVTRSPRRNDISLTSSSPSVLTCFLTWIETVYCSLKFLFIYFPYLWIQTCSCFAPRTPVWIPDWGDPQTEFSLPSLKLLLARRPLEDSALLCSPTRQSQVPPGSATSPPRTHEDVCSPRFFDRFRSLFLVRNWKKWLRHRGEEQGLQKRPQQVGVSLTHVVRHFIYSFFSNTSSVFSSAEAQKDPGRNRVPVVCLERLKILVSQLPPHGRRQSDPLPASGTEAPPPQSTWQAALTEVRLILLWCHAETLKGNLKGNQILYVFFISFGSSSPNHFVWAKN